MLKYVVSTGCSYSDHAFELENWDTRDPKFKSPEVLDEDGKQVVFTSYGKELAEHLDAEYIHLAQCGSGIEYSIHKLWQWIQDNPDKLEESVLLMGISMFQRQDILVRHSDTGEEQRINFPNPRVIQEKKDMYEWEVVADLNKWPANDFKNYVKFFWQYVFDWNLNQTQRLTSLTTFEAYCKQRGINIIFISTINKDIVDDKIEVFKFPTGDWSWRNYIHSYDKTYTAGHPNTYDHRHLGQLLYEYIQKTYL